MKIHSAVLKLLQCGQKNTELDEQRGEVTEALLQQYWILG
jgi:hypothetical protein